MTTPRVLVVAPEGVRPGLVTALGTDRRIKVVGHTAAPADVADLIQRERPDMIVVDLGLPSGAARRVIAEIMAATPLPILALEDPVGQRAAGGDGNGWNGSARVTTTGAEALAAGAVEVMDRPAPGDPVAAARLRRRAEILRGVSVIRRPLRAAAGGPGGGWHPAGSAGWTRTPVVALGASTGGPAALGTVLGGLDGVRATVLIVQHLHPDFVEGFVTFLARVAAIPVHLAVDGARAEPGIAYVSPSGMHLRLGPDRRLRLGSEPASLYRPSADVLFRSVADVAGGDAVGVLLTGMGDDGAAGLLAIRQAGGSTIVQDEASSAVFGMPGAAQRLGAASQVLPLDRIARAVTRGVARVAT
jgi:two-component system chemotaxis response regulator CheB